MRLKTGAAVLALLAGAALPVRAADHLVLTEFAVTPTDAEFIEIFNPTTEVVDLTDYYLSDFVLSSDPTQNYWRLVDGTLVPEAGFDTDFLARFPAGATILPGQTIVVSLHDDTVFTEFWAGGGRTVPVDFEMVQDGAADGVPDMVDPGPATIGQRLIQANAGLSNAREVVVLFHWDGVSDLVQDVDIVQWGNAGPVFNTISPVKTGVQVDGPDADATPTAYLADSPAAEQDLASTGDSANDVGLTVSRVDFDEGLEPLAGGNGLTGHNETGENYSATWAENTPPSIGSPGEFGPPALLGGAARSAESFELEFSRVLDATTAARTASYSILQVLTPAGEPANVPLAVRDAELLPDGRRVLLATAEQVPLALYEVRVSGVLSEDGNDAVAPGTRVLLRGYNPGPGLRIVVPRRPFVPTLDGPMEIAYEAPQGRGILLRVFDPSGRELFVLAEEAAPAGGLRTIRWDGRDRLRQRLPAGVYTLHLEIPASGEETAVPIVIGSPNEETLR